MNWRCWLFGHDEFQPDHMVIACARCGLDTYHDEDEYGRIWGGLWWLRELWTLRFEIWRAVIREDPDSEQRLDFELTMLWGRMKDNWRARHEWLGRYNVLERCAHCERRIRPCNPDVDHTPDLPF